MREKVLDVSNEGESTMGQIELSFGSDKQKKKMVLCRGQNSEDIIQRSKSLFNQQHMS